MYNQNTCIYLEERHTRKHRSAQGSKARHVIYSFRILAPGLVSAQNGVGAEQEMNGDTIYLPSSAGPNHRARGREKFQQLPLADISLDQSQLSTHHILIRQRRPGILTATHNALLDFFGACDWHSAQDSDYLGLDPKKTIISFSRNYMIVMRISTFYQKYQWTVF